MILASDEHSEKRHKLVAKLVQLRLQQQEIKVRSFCIFSPATLVKPLDDFLVHKQMFFWRF